MKLTGRVQKTVVNAGTKRTVLYECAEMTGITLSECPVIGDGANDCLTVELAEMSIAYQTKPALKNIADIHINHIDLRTALYFQGYSDALVNDKL